MGARQKLNQAHFNGALVLAAMMGLATESWAVFWIVLLLGLASSLFGGGIRTKPRR